MISRELAISRLAEVLVEYVGACSRVRGYELAFFAAPSADVADQVAEAWRAAVAEARAIRISIKNIEDTFHAKRGSMRELVDRLDLALVPKLQRRAAA